MQLPEPTNCHAVSHRARRAIRMQPLRRQSCLGGKTVEVHRAHLEPRQHLLHHALHVVEIERRGRVQRALFRQASHRSERQRGPLVHFVRRSAKHRSQLRTAAHRPRRDSGCRQSSPAFRAPATAAARLPLRSADCPAAPPAPAAARSTHPRPPSKTCSPIASWNPAASIVPRTAASFSAHGSARTPSPNAGSVLANRLYP